jgi:transposase
MRWWSSLGRCGGVGSGSPIVRGSVAGYATTWPGVPTGERFSFAVEGCTGWRYVVEEIAAAGFEAHRAEPADTQAARGRKRHAKTDRSDSRLLRELLVDGKLPESWMAPEVVLEWRERVRVYKSLVDQRTTWVQRIHAELFQHGVAVPEGAIRADKTRGTLGSAELEVSAAARQRIGIGYSMIDAIDGLAKPLKADLQRCGQRQAACRALVDAQYGIGGLLAVAIWSELGDCQRFARSDQVVRHSGLDVTVDSSDRRRASGFLSRQGPETLRWALYEAAKNSSHHASPDHGYYTGVKTDTTASWPPSRWPARSPAVASTFYARSTPTWCTPRRSHCRSVATVGIAQNSHQ